MASSLQSCIGAVANGLVAGVLAPFVMHSTVGLAVASLGLLGVGLVAWMYVHWRWPGLGRSAHAGADG
jgi:DHA1 family bicyclomycin/chloramphenicol resistance-like MFS transporter